MAATQVTSKEPYTAWEMVPDLPDPTNPTAPSVLDAWQMMFAIAPAGYRSHVEVFAQTLVDETGVTTGDVTFMLTITKQDFPDQPAPVGTFVVFDGTYATVIDAATYAANYTAAPAGT